MVEEKQHQWITTQEAAAILKLTRRRIVQLINGGKLKAHKWGRDWQVKLESVEEYRRKNQ
jgi:excisionase family DNA binding protein